MPHPPTKEKVFPATQPPAFDALPLPDAASFAVLPVARRRAIYEELAAELARKVASEKKAEAMFGEDFWGRFGMVFHGSPVIFGHICDHSS